MKSAGKLTCKHCDKRFNVGMDCFIVRWEEVSAAFNSGGSVFSGDTGATSDHVQVASEKELRESDNYDAIYANSVKAISEGETDSGRLWKCPYCKESQQYELAADEQVPNDEEHNSAHTTSNADKWIARTMLPGGMAVFVAFFSWIFQVDPTNRVPLYLLIGGITGILIGCVLIVIDPRLRDT